jgi:hypothetical protein
VQHAGDGQPRCDRSVVGGTEQGTCIACSSCSRVSDMPSVVWQTQVSNALSTHYFALSTRRGTQSSWSTADPAGHGASGRKLLVTHRQQLITCIIHSNFHHLGLVLCDPLLPLQLKCTELLLLPVLPHFACCLPQATAMTCQG